jgi:hypothetical protein
VGIVVPELGVVEYVGGGAAEILLVVVIQAEITCLYAGFTAFHIFRPPYWILQGNKYSLKAPSCSQFIYRNVYYRCVICSATLTVLPLGQAPQAGRATGRTVTCRRAEVR